MYIECFKYTYHKNLAHIFNMADPLKHAASWPTPDTNSDIQISAREPSRRRGTVF